MRCASSVLKPRRAAGGFTAVGHDCCANQRPRVFVVYRCSSRHSLGAPWLTICNSLLAAVLRARRIMQIHAANSNGGGGGGGGGGGTSSAPTSSSTSSQAASEAPDQQQRSQHQYHQQQLQQQTNTRHVQYQPGYQQQQQARQQNAAVPAQSHQQEKADRASGVADGRCLPSAVPQVAMAPGTAASLGGKTSAEAVSSFYCIRSVLRRCPVRQRCC